MITFRFRQVLLYMLQADSCWSFTLEVRIQSQACHFGIYRVFVITLLYVFPVSHMRASLHALSQSPWFCDPSLIY